MRERRILLKAKAVTKLSKYPEENKATRIAKCMLSWSVPSVVRLWTLLNMSLANLSNIKASSSDIKVVSYSFLSFNFIQLYATIAPTRPLHRRYLH